jgi:sugar phosphate isomerase/epimerase
MLASYGDRLFATHLNDNLGISREDGEIFWTDDLHLLPFDGIADWDNIAARLDKWGYSGILTFELTVKSKPDRHENDKYAQMPLEEYIAECYIRACRLAYMRKNISFH